MAYDVRAKVKVYYAEKKYGFAQLSTGEDAFFHKQACSRNVTPKPGDRIRCEVVSTDKGYKITSLVFDDVPPNGVSR